MFRSKIQYTSSCIFSERRPGSGKISEVSVPENCTCLGSDQPYAISSRCRSHGRKCRSCSGNPARTGCPISETILSDKSIRGRVEEFRCGQPRGISDQYPAPGTGRRDFKPSNRSDADGKNFHRWTGPAGTQTSAGEN